MADRLPVEVQCLLVLPRLEGLVALLAQQQRLRLLSCEAPTDGSIRSRTRPSVFQAVVDQCARYFWRHGSLWTLHFTCCCSAGGEKQSDLQLCRSTKAHHHATNTTGCCYPPVLTAASIRYKPCYGTLAAVATARQHDKHQTATCLYTCAHLLCVCTAPLLTSAAFLVHSSVSVSIAAATGSPPPW